MEELLNIHRIGRALIGANPQQWQQPVNRTKEGYDQLMLQKLKLEQRRNTKNPFKKLANYRAALSFFSASKELYLATKSHSEEVERNLLSFAAEDILLVDGDAPPGTGLGGLAVRLEHPLDDTAEQQILDAINAMISSSAVFEEDETISDTSSFLRDDYVSSAESLLSLISSDTETPEDASSPPSPTSRTTISDDYYSAAESLSLISSHTEESPEDASSRPSPTLRTTIQNQYFIGCIFFLSTLKCAGNNNPVWRVSEQWLSV
ncbi:hypothetical protein L210DRAFT_3654575 [Boletus edulis BED1]|uniref:Uncharacterized protein n=1 Tax=Boletus edulis BED1 TaxID=1328754 RepID=A0AAD4BDU4_BOLED|nr:hypothetical protein L210DRAFT_3654575 [Boletus edulis BED1]